MHAGARALALGLGLWAGCSGPSATGPASAPDRPAVEQTPDAEASTPAPVPEAVLDEGKAAEPEPEPEPAAEPAPPVEDPWLVEILKSNRKVARLMEDPARYRFQVLVTVIAPEGPDGPPMVEHGYRADAEYIYPASAIKTFASVGALRELKKLRAEGHEVGVRTPMAYCDGDSKRCKSEDPSNVAAGTITVGHEIRKMQLVSNNHAFNRLYELVGHREINEQMWALGFDSLRVHHRMYGVQDPVVQRTTPRIELRPKRGKTVVIPARVSDLELPPTEATELQLGVGYIDDETGELVEEPLDFSGKNYVSVRDLHRLTLALARPDLPGVIDLGLDESDRKFLLKAMTDDPLESDNPVYDSEHDSGLRYHTMIKGMMTVVPLERIRYVGKAGRAYGFHLDNAYVEDRKTGRAMAVTVVAYANANGVLNDNKYEYDKITRPLLKGMGIVLAKAVLLGKAL